MRFFTAETIESVEGNQQYPNGSHSRFMCLQNLQIRNIYCVRAGYKKICITAWLGNQKSGRQIGWVRLFRC